MTHHSDMIAALVGSRICHELISPAGAVSNGIELLGMAGTTDGPEMQLLRDSAATTNARIRLFRLAFGQATDGQGVAHDEITGLLSELHENGRISLVAFPDQDFDRMQAKALMLALLCAEHALPFGGQLRVSIHEGLFQIRAESDRLGADPALWALLQGDPTPDVLDVPPSAVEFLLLPRLLGRMGRRCEVQITGKAAEITF